MNAKRRTASPTTLPCRMYPKHGAWHSAPVIYGKIKWIKLYRFEEGETRMLERLAEEKRKQETALAPAGNVPQLVKSYMAEKKAGKAETGQVEWERQGNGVAKYFREWNVADIDPAAVHDFLEGNFPDKIPTQRSYRAWLSGFFGWCILRRHATANPCKEVKLKKPKKRKVYITDAHFMEIRNALAIGDDGKKTPTGDMMQCFIDLCYLTLQRSTEVRELAWANVGDDVIHFVPSKTEDSSGEAVDCPITPEIRAVLDRARKLQPICEYVIRDKDGKPKTAKAVRDAWNDTKRRAKLKDTPYTIKDIRGKAVTDGEKLGYNKEELRVAAAHTTAETTEIYLKDKQIPVSTVKLKMPAS